MSKWCCIAGVLAVICLPVILLSLETDAQRVVEETTSCSSSGDASTLEVRIISTQKGKATEQIEGCGDTNDTRLEEAIRKVKDELENKFGTLRDEINDMKRQLESRQTKCECVTAPPTVNPPDIVTVEPSKQALVSQLIGEYTCLDGQSVPNAYVRVT